MVHIADDDDIPDLDSESDDEEDPSAQPRGRDQSAQPCDCVRSVRSAVGPSDPPLPETQSIPSDPPLPETQSIPQLGSNRKEKCMHCHTFFRVNTNGCFRQHRCGPGNQLVCPGSHQPVPGSSSSHQPAPGSSSVGMQVRTRPSHGFTPSSPSAEESAQRGQTSGGGGFNSNHHRCGPGQHKLAEVAQAARFC